MMYKWLFATKGRSIATVALLAILALALAACGLQAAARPILTSASQDYAKATALINQGNCSDALKAYAQALSKNPVYISAYVGEAACYSQLGSNYQALLAYSKAISIDPLNAALYFARASVEQNNGQNGAAYADCSKGAKLVGFNPLAAYQQAATCFTSFGDFLGANHALAEAIRLSPKSSDLYSLKAQVEARYSDTAGVTRDLSSAFRYAKSNQQKAQVLTAEADYFAGQDDVNRAIQIAWHVIQLTPKQAAAWISYAQYLATAKEFPQAFQAYVKVERMTPRTTWTAAAYEQHGDLLAQLGRKREAALMYRNGVHTAMDASQRTELQNRLSSLNE